MSLVVGSAVLASVSFPSVRLFLCSISSFKSCGDFLLGLIDKSFNSVLSFLAFRVESFF